MKYGVIIARFQTDDLTDGHKALIDAVKRASNQVIVMLGVRDCPPSDVNPLSFQLRINMVHDWDKSVIVVPIYDQPSDYIWSQTVDTKIKEIIGMGNTAEIFTGRDGFVDHYHGHYPVTVLDLGIDYVSASARRETIKNNPQQNRYFRAGIIHAYQNLTKRIFLTIDIALFHQYGNAMAGSKLKILLGKKPTDKLWRLPGGFVDAGESFKQAVARELKEEANTYAVDFDHMHYVGDYEIDDWRVRDTARDTHKTVLFACLWDGFTHPKAGDDLAEICWMEVDKLDTTCDIVEGHRKLVDEAIKAIRKQYETK